MSKREKRSPAASAEALAEASVEPANGSVESGADSALDGGVATLTAVEVQAKPVEATDGLAAKLMPAIEAIVFSAERAAPPARIAEALGLISAPDGEVATADDDAGPEATKLIADVIGSLNEQYSNTGRAFRIERVQGGYRVMTLAAHSDAVAAFHHSRSAARLSKAGIETLAIIAYKQPITRAQLEAIRGVACGEVLKSLMDRRLITIKGRAEELGRPMLYGTSKGFLEHFGLASITDLPSVAELRAGQS
jgi:segregation and condensation protein B